MKITLFILLLTLGVFSSYTQEKNRDHKEYTSIINSTIDDSLRERKVDSFFKQKSESLPTLDLANCYHDYSLSRYKKWRVTNNKKQLKKAIEYAEKAFNMKSKIKEIPQESIDKSLFNLGVFNFQNYDYFKAIDHFTKLIEVGKRKKVIKAYNELGSSYIQTGDFHKALNSTEKAFELCKPFDDNQKNIINIYLLRADIYSLMGYKEYSKEIKENLRKVDSILDLVLFNTKKLKNRMYQIEGNRLLKTEKYRDAILVFSRILETQNPLDSINQAIAYNSLGLSFLKIQELDEAKFNLENAIRYNPTYTATYENLGDLYLKKNEFQKGIYQYQKAINYSIGNYGEFNYKNLIDKEKLETANNKYYLLHHLIQKAKGWIEYYHHDQDQDHLYQAINTFKMADQLVDIIRFESSEYKSKLYWRENASALYMKAVEASFLLKNTEDAYYFMEKNKAILLLEDITNEQAKENAKLPQKLAGREFLLKQNIYLSENKLNTLSDASHDTLQKIKKEIYQHKRKYEVFVDSLHVLYPDYAINKQKIGVLPYNSFVTKFISNQETVLQYILSKDQGYGIFHAHDRQLFFEIQNVEELLNDIDLLNQQITSWFKNQTELNAYHKSSHRIFQKLIPESVYSHIKGKNLTIIPDYGLQRLSFETLITSSQEHSYLIKDTEIRYVYSMTYLDQNNLRKRASQLNFLGVAPVDFDIENLGSLVHSRKEVTTISDILSGDTLLDEEGTKVNALDSLNQYRIIHLSTHADIGNHATPWIAFRDQKMTLQEVYATKNQSEMVVLSACKTSLGELNIGEGVMSLARGFFYSGTNSVVSSLWSVNDKANQELMIDFYKNIDKGLSKSSALRNAKLQYINSHDGSELSPFYWGSLILIGNNDVIDFDRSFALKIYGSLILFLIVIAPIGFYYFFRRKTERLNDIKST